MSLKYHKDEVSHLIDSKQTNLNAEKTSTDSIFREDIGKTIASKRFLNNMDGFWFAVRPNTIINSFDFVTVDNLHNSKTIGIVKELQAVEEDLYGDFVTDHQKKQIKQGQIGGDSPNGSVLAKVGIMANTGATIEDNKESISINFPVGTGKPVRFATEDEIIFALGIPEMVDPIPAGIIETTNGLQVPISLALT